MSDSIEDRLRASIRDVPDFPREGVLFKDITTLLKDVKSFRLAVDEMSRSWNAPQLGQPPDKILGIESRGFIFGAPMAYQIGAGLLVARKPGKLPSETVRAAYALEYGEDALELHVDAIGAGERVLIVDDLLATGGTAAAAIELVEQLGGVVVGLQFLIELGFLHGRAKLGSYTSRAVLTYS